MDFGQLLVDRGLVTPKDLEDALAEQRRYIVQGRNPVPRLGEILVSRGILTERQVTEALQSQNKEILFCPRCRIQVNVELREDAAGYRCGTCKGDLVRPAELNDVSATDTAVILVARGPLPQEVEEAVKEPARKFGKYILLEEIGRGGAAIVHRAWDSYLNQYVALKFLKRPPGAERDVPRHESQVIDLLQEARSTIRLRHPNIVTIYDVGRVENQFYIAMDCLEGRSLSAHLRAARERGRISPIYDEPKRYVSVLRDVCRAAHYAHTRQIPVIHCDLKPSNIFVDNDWKTFVLDFGLARRLREAGSGDGAIPGTIRGTPAYMAPEQASGRTNDIDARTDVYGIGAVLYELLAGRPPFSGEILTLLQKVANEPPEPPSEVRRLSQDSTPDAALWGTLERICLKAIQKDKAHRYQTAREMAEDFDRSLRGALTERRVSTHHRRQKTPSSIQGPASVPMHGHGALVRGALTVEEWMRAARRRWKALTAVAAGAIVLLIAAILIWAGLPKGPSQQEGIFMRAERMIAELRPDQSEALLKSWAPLLSNDPRMESTREDIDWTVRMRNHLIDAINKKPEYAPEVLELRGRLLRGAVVVGATTEMITVAHDGLSEDLAWGELRAEAAVKMISSHLLVPDAGNPVDRIGLAIYCEKNGLTEEARRRLGSLEGTDLQIIARRYLARLDARRP